MLLGAGITQVRRITVKVIFQSRCNQWYTTHAPYQLKIYISADEAEFGFELGFVFFSDFCSILVNVLDGHIDVAYEFIIPPASVVVTITQFVTIVLVQCAAIHGVICFAHAAGIEVAM